LLRSGSRSIRGDRETGIETETRSRGNPTVVALKRQEKVVALEKFVVQV